MLILRMSISVIRDTAAVLLNVFVCGSRYHTDRAHYLNCQSFRNLLAKTFGRFSRYILESHTKNTLLTGVNRTP